MRLYHPRRMCMCVRSCVCVSVCLYVQVCFFGLSSRIFILRRRTAYHEKTNTSLREAKIIRSTNKILPWKLKYFPLAVCCYTREYSVLPSLYISKEYASHRNTLTRTHTHSIAPHFLFRLAFFRSFPSL